MLVPPVPHVGQERHDEVLHRRFILPLDLREDPIFNLNSYSLITFRTWEFDRSVEQVTPMTSGSASANNEEASHDEDNEKGGDEEADNDERRTTSRPTTKRIDGDDEDVSDH
jgi:hypothetical protein